MSRTGKIARLPRLLREEVNRRLDNGDTGQDILKWLNPLPEVQTFLKEHFGGKPITEQNLSEWRLGGFQDWLREQSTRVWLRSIADQTETLREDLRYVPITDCLATPLAVVMGRTLERLASEPAHDPESLKQLLALVRGFSQLRHADHEQQRIRIQRKRACLFYNHRDPD